MRTCRTCKAGIIITLGRVCACTTCQLFETDEDAAAAVDELLKTLTAVYDLSTGTVADAIDAIDEAAKQATLELGARAGGRLDPERDGVIRAAAVAEATRLCDNALGAVVRLGATAAQFTRARWYQTDEFRLTSRRIERVVSELFAANWKSRAELLAAIAVYCTTGIAEVNRLFDAAQGTSAK